MRQIDTARFTEYRLDAGERPKARFVYFVSGRGEFPYDMLRYDRAAPYSTEDAVKLGSPYFTPENREELRKIRTVQLVSYQEPTVDRWSSFMWSVSSHDPHFNR